MRSDITVVMGVFNGGAVIGRCLDSLLDQTLMPEQIIVVDDGSTDATVEVVDRFGRVGPG